MKRTQFSEKVSEIGYHAVEHIDEDLGYIEIWKHGDYICRIDYRGNTYVMSRHPSIPQDIKDILIVYADS